MPTSSKALGPFLGCLIALGVGAQAWLLYEMRYDLPVTLNGDAEEVLAQLPFTFSPLLLASVGFLLATWLRRRGSRWAWVAAGLPFALLVLGTGLALYLTFFPISFNHH